MRTAVGLVLVLVLCTWATAGPGAPATMKPDPQRHETTYDTRALWSTGHANVSFDGGTVMLTQPQPTWNSSGTASMSRYGACAVGLPNGDVLIMGGSVDPDPQAQGDETDTADVLIWDEMNGSWTASDQMMAQTHVWCAATFGAGKVFVVGDWSPESGEEFSQGRLSILDLQNDSGPSGHRFPRGVRQVLSASPSTKRSETVRCGGCHQLERIDATTHPDLLRSSDGLGRTGRR